MTTLEQIRAIEAEIRNFEERFRPKKIPAGTPNRKQLQREENERCYRQSVSPEAVRQRQELLKRLRVAKANWKRQATLAVKKADPVEQKKRWVMQKLRRMGFKRETKTSSGSVYYRKGETRVRISDHEVPLTPEREYYSQLDSFTWAVGGWQLLVTDSWWSLARIIVLIRREIRQ